MSKKSIIRRSLALGFCLLLMIITFLLPINKTVVRAGTGKGTNRKIQTTAELSALLEHVANQMERGAEPLALAAASESPEYESVTVEDTLRDTLILRAGTAYTKLRIDRNMTAYLTKEATYYVSEATISSVYRMPEQTVDGKVVQEAIDQKTDLSIRIHLYFDQEVCMILFDRYTYFLNGKNHALPAAALGKWVVFSTEDDYGIYNSLASVDRHNFASLALIGEMLADESLFKRSGSTYTMTDEAFLGFLTGLESIDGVSSTATGNKRTGRFAADFKNKHRPSVTLSFKDYYKGTLDLAQTEELTFSNIDNTVIGKPAKRGTLTAEEMNAFFEGWEE